jgi:hypothetical protein
MRGDGLEVGDIGEVQGDTRSPGVVAGGDDGGGAGRKQDAGVVGGRGGIERDASSERCGDRVGVGDGARGGHGNFFVHGTGSGGADGMRGDGVGVGDIGEVQGDTRIAGDVAGGDDGGGAGREQDTGVVGGRGGIERDASTERCGDRVGVDDGARCQFGACQELGTGSAWAHGMRGDGVGVGDIGEVQGHARSPGDTTTVDYHGRAGRECDAGVVGGRGGIERDASTEPTGDRLGVDDDARGEHGACEEHWTGSGGAHGMRGDGLGVGDIGEVQGDTRDPGDAAASDDGGGAGRERDAGVVGGRGGIERGASTEPSRDRFGVDDGARGGHGACDAYGSGSGGAHGMRGVGLGVGDIGEVQGDTRSAWYAADGDDGGGAGREQDAGVVGGRWGIERDASTEPSGDRVGVGDGARGEHWAFAQHWTGSGGAHGMRGDGLGVGDIGEVRVDTRSLGNTAVGDDGGGAGRERDAGVVGGRWGIERDASTEPGRDRLVVFVGARGEHGACEEHWTGSGWANGMRGHGVGVGDIDALQLVARGTGITADGD